MLASPKKGAKCLKSDRIIPENERFISPDLGKNDFKIALPGHGSIGNDLCGEFKLALQCKNGCDDPKIIFHNCGSPTCPYCYENAISKMASRITERIESVISSYKLNGINVGNAKHGVYSPPPGKYKKSDFDTKSGYDRLIKESSEAFKFLSNGDYTGCLPIIHPWRQCHTDGTICDDPNCKRNHLWYFSPHAHLIYTGYLKQSNELYHSKKFKGSIFKRIDDKGKKRNIANTIAYLLSHAGIPFNNKAVENPYLSLFDSKSKDWFNLKKEIPITYKSKIPGQVPHYFGIFANCKAGKVIIATQDRLLVCPKCESEILKYDRLDQNNQVVKSSVHDSPFFLRVNVYQWNILVNGQRLQGVRSAEIEDEPYGFLLSLSERQKMQSSIKLDDPPAQEIQILHYRRDPATDSNWPEFNYYEY